MTKRTPTALCLCAAALALALAHPAAAATHMGQATADHVIVHFFGGMQGGECTDYQDAGVTTLYMQRLFPDGSLAPFSIPKGKVLVVTDFDISTYVPSHVGTRASLRGALRLKQAGAKSGGTIAWRDSFHLTEDLVSKNFVLEGQSLSGILVSDKAALCPSITYDDGNPEALIVTGGNYRGYLIDANSPPTPSEDPTGARDDGDVPH